MANFKKEDKAWLIAKIWEFEKKVEVLDKKVEELENWKNEIENYGSKWDTNPPGVILSSRATNEMRKLEVLEKRMDEVEKEVKELKKFVIMPEQAPLTLPVNADGKTVLTDKTLFLAVPAAVATTEVHKCQTNTCVSMATKPYDRPSGRLWLCESHKF